MIVGSLFAGIGGFDEGLRQAGMESLWQVEKEPFCLKVLKTRFPNAERAHDILTCRGLTSSVPASHARIGRSRERERDCLERAAASFTSLQESCTSFDPLGSCSRMFPDFSVLTTDETLRKSSGFSWSSAGMGFNGVCLTASFSESPSAAAVCSLSDVLESHAPQRFFLSQKAAQGILRRAKKRGRTLPERLMTALQVLAGQNHQAKPCASMSEQPTPCGAAPTDTQPSLTSGEESLATRPDEGGRMTSTSRSGPGPQPPLSHSVDNTDSTQPLSTSSSEVCNPTPNGMDTPCQPSKPPKTGKSLKPHSVSAKTPEESDRATTQPTPSRTCEAERGTKPITAKGSTADSEPNRENILSVRRLTPTECEVLQGFPKGWTLPDTALLGMLSPFQSSSGLEIESSSLDR